MKNRMKRLTALVLMGALAVIVLAACGSKSESAAPNGQGESAEQAVSQFLTAIKNRDEKTAAKYLEDGDDIDLSFDEVSEMAALYEKVLDFDHEIISSEEKGNSAKVKVKIKTYHYGEFFGQVIKDYLGDMLSTAFNSIQGGGEFDEEAARHLLEETVNSNLDLLAEKDNEVEVDVNLKMKEDGWKIASADDLADGLFGGALEKMKEAFEGIGK